MSTETTHYNFVKPSADDEYNIDVTNANMDAIDTAIKESKDAADEAKAKADDIAHGVAYVSLADGDVVLSDVGKGTIIITAAHDTQCLILPATNSPKYTVINKDNGRKARIKAVGHNEVLKVDKDSVAQVVYNGVDRYLAISGGGGGAFDVSDVGGTLQEGLSPGTCLLPDENNVWRPAQNGIVILGADGRVYPSGTVCDVTGIDTTLIQKKNLYAQPNGGISVMITISKVGYVLSGSLVYVDIPAGSLGEDYAYTDDMQYYYAMPYLSTKLRLKFKKPSTAEGVKIYRSTTQYESGSVDSWGQLVANIENDSNYDGPNEWYVDSNGGVGLSQHTNYYYKFVPFVGSMSNEAKGCNELKCCTQSGLVEWTGDSRSGSQVLDTFGSNNLNVENISFQPLAVGTAMEFNGSNSRFTIEDEPTTDISSWIFKYQSSNTSGDKILLSQSHYNNGGNFGFYVAVNASGNVIIRTGNGESSTVIRSVTTELSANVKYDIGFVLNKTSKSLKVYINGVKIGEATSIGTINSFGHPFIGFREMDSYAGVYTKSMILDQIRAFSGDIGDDGFAQLFNGGIDI